jgi:lipopolysaccharide transport system permease protein
MRPIEERVIGETLSTAQYLREAWADRELVALFMRQHVKVRYKQSVLGVLWLVLQPLGMAVMFTLFFGLLLRVPSDGTPYGAFVLTGMVLWQFFSRGVSEASISLSSQSAILSKVYFPRILIPVVAVLGAGIDFLVIVAVVLVILVVSGTLPGPMIVMAPLFALLAAVAAIAAGVWLTAIDVLYRDLRNLLPLALQALMYATPIIYPASLIPAQWLWLYRLNPMVPIVEGFRFSLLPGAVPPGPGDIAYSAAVIAIVLSTGLVVFRRVERVLVDRV